MILYFSLMIYLINLGNGKYEISKLKNRPSKGVFVFEYMQEQIERLRGQGKERTVETYQSALNSFMKFRDGIDLCFDEMDADLMEHYETEMRSTHHLSRNTTSFYMRILRCVYRKAVGEGLALPADILLRMYILVWTRPQRELPP